MTNSGLAAREVSGNKYRIGGATIDFAADADISAVAIYASALTDAEIDAVAAAMRKRALRLGLSV
jgi:hypothetical protein